MTTTEIATLDDLEAPEPQQLSKREAKALDKRIRSASDKVSTTTENLLDLLEQAAAGQIHVALELPSWTAWFKDAVQIQISDKFERKELVKLMSGKGMSQRAIAGSLGVSQKTVDRDLDGEDVQEGATVTSLDGPQRPKNRPEVIDAEVVDDEEDSEVEAEPMKAVDIVSSFDDEMANLFAAQNELSELVAEEKWAGARKRVIKAGHINNLQEIISSLQYIVDDLMSDGAS